MLLTKKNKFLLTLVALSTVLITNVVNTCNRTYAAPISTPITQLLLSSTEFPFPGTWDRRYLTGNQVEALGKRGPLKFDQHFDFTPPACNPFDVSTLLFLQQYTDHSEEALFTNTTTKRKISVTLTPDTLDAEPRFNHFYSTISSCQHFTITQNYPNHTGRVRIYGSYTFIPKPNISQTINRHIRAFTFTSHEIVTTYHDNRQPTKTNRQFSITTYMALVRGIWVTVGEETVANQDIINITPVFQNQTHKVLIAQ